MLGAGTGPSLALATPTPTPAAASTPTPPSPPAPAPAATSKLKQKQKQKDDDDKMGLSTLPYDLLLNIATYLDLRDVHSLQLTCRSLYDASTTRPVYRKLATDLLRRCRALPLKGFQRLADLSTEALIHAVNKANHYEAAWRVRAPRPIGWGEAEAGGGGGGGDGYDERGVNSHSNYMDVAPGGKLAARLKLEEDAASASSSASSSSSSSLSRSKTSKTKKNKWYKIVSAPPGEEVDWLSPITSSYTLCATKSGKVVCWDVQRDVCLAEWNPGARWELWKCRVEFEERTVFFTMAKVVTGSYDDDRVMNFVLMRLTFSDGPSGESAPTPPVFAHVTEFKTTGVVMNVFLLDPSERLLSAFVWVSTSNTIGLYALLDWAEREYVFVDTGIECVMSSNWSCILFQNNIVIHCEEADAAFQHFYPLALLRAYTSVLPDKEATPVISRRVPPARTLKKRFVFPVFEDTEEEEEMEEAEDSMEGVQSGEDMYLNTNTPILLNGVAGPSNHSHHHNHNHSNVSNSSPLSSSTSSSSSSSSASSSSISSSSSSSSSSLSVALAGPSTPSALGITPSPSVTPTLFAPPPPPPTITPPTTIPPPHAHTHTTHTAHTPNPNPYPFPPWYPESAHFVRQWWPSLPSIPRVSCTVVLLAAHDQQTHRTRFVLAQHYFRVPLDHRAWEEGMGDEGFSHVLGNGDGGGIGGARQKLGQREQTQTQMGGASSSSSSKSPGMANGLANGTSHTGTGTRARGRTLEDAQDDALMHLWYVSTPFEVVRVYDNAAGGGGGGANGHADGGNGNGNGAGEGNGADGEGGEGEGEGDPDPDPDDGGLTERPRPLVAVDFGHAVWIEYVDADADADADGDADEDDTEEEDEQQAQDDAQERRCHHHRSDGIASRHGNASGSNNADANAKGSTSAPTAAAAASASGDSDPKWLRFVTFPPFSEEHGVELDRRGTEGEVRTLDVPPELDLGQVETINIDQSQGAVILSDKAGRIFILCYE